MYGNLALSMLEDLDFGTVESRTVFLVHCFIYPYTRNWHDCLKPLLHGYQTGLVHGDTESALWNMMTYIELSFNTGKPLEALENDVRIYRKQMKDLKLDIHASVVGCMQQYIENLRGVSGSTYKFPDAQKALEQHRKDGSVVEGGVRQAQLHLATFFGEDEYGAEIVVDIAENGMKISEASHGFFLITFESALLCYGAWRKQNRNRYTKHARSYHSQVKSWVKAGHVSMVFALHLLDAEVAMNSGKHDIAFQQYEAAAMSAKELNYRSYHGLALERWGNAKAELGDHKEARKQWKNALVLYEEWGATAVVRQLRKKIKHSSKPSPK